MNTSGLASSAAGADPAPDVVIDVEGLTKSFGGRTVVKDLTMQVRRGLIYGFLGPNGSGKTTTIRMLCGLLTPDAGEGTCLGLDLVRQAADIRRQVGYMTQKFGLYDDLSIRQNLDFVGRLFELPRRRHHGAGLHALHGRGRTLPRARLHRLWQGAGARHRRGDHP